MKNNLGITILLFLIGSRSISQTNSIAGKWRGGIATPMGKLEMVLKIEESSGIYSVKMDVPMQSVKDIPASQTRFTKDSIIIDFAVIRAGYKGIFKKDSSCITGVWQQSGATISMPLVPLVGELLKRPQEPKPPFPYKEEEVLIENKKDNVKLAGTLTLPANKTNCPVAILISGSGPQKRNTEIFGHKEFMVIADYLTRNGIAVLRYDDRGVGASTGNFPEATSFDFSSDAEAIVEYLKTRKEINKKKIGLIGHSEGGLVAPLLASRSKDIGFVIMLAGPGIICTELMALQNAAQARVMGQNETAIAEQKILNLKMYGFAIKNEIDSIKFIMKQMGAAEKLIDTESKRLVSPWFRYFLAYEPGVVLPKVSCPLLAINGKKDLQVTYPENPDGVEAIFKKCKKKNYSVKVFDDLNHLMQHCKTGAVTEYGTIEETFAPEVLKLMGDWINGSI